MDLNEYGDYDDYMKELAREERDYLGEYKERLEQVVYLRDFIKESVVRGAIHQWGRRRGFFRVCSAVITYSNGTQHRNEVYCTTGVELRKVFWELEEFFKAVPYRKLYCSNLVKAHELIKQFLERNY